MADLPYYEFYTLVEGENDIRVKVEVTNNSQASNEAGLVEAIKAYMSSLPNFQGSSYVRKAVAGTPV